MVGANGWCKTATKLYNSNKLLPNYSEQITFVSSCLAKLEENTYVMLFKFMLPEVRKYMHACTAYIDVQRVVLTFANLAN